jgi:effector-binding domain-containing protein
MAIEEPKYTVVKTDGKIEIREYQSYIVAEVFIPGSEMNEASNAGFRKLFKYISGNNKSSTDIAMTAPVTTTRSEKIEMTAPVTTQQTADGYTIAFVLPEEFTLATAPVPADSTIHLREIPVRRTAVIRFSGRWTDENMLEHQQMLFNWLKEHSIAVVAPPIIARYDPPFMPWFLRRNEIQIDIPAFHQD